MNDHYSQQGGQQTGRSQGSSVRATASISGSRRGKIVIGCGTHPQQGPQRRVERP